MREHKQLEAKTVTFVLFVHKYFVFAAVQSDRRDDQTHLMPSEVCWLNFDPPSSEEQQEATVSLPVTTARSISAPKSYWVITLYTFLMESI